MAVKLPVNFTEEQKTVLAVLSIRQLLLLFPINVAWLLLSISLPLPILIKITVGIVFAGVSLCSRICPNGKVRLLLIGICST